MVPSLALPPYFIPFQDCRHIHKSVAFGDATYLGECACLEQRLVPPPPTFALPVPPSHLDPHEELPYLYLDLVKSTVINSIYRDHASTIDGKGLVHPRLTVTTCFTSKPIRLRLASKCCVITGWDWTQTPLRKSEDGLTMVGRRRLDNVHEILETVVREGIPGDFIEAGSWRGGVPIFVAAFLKTYGQLGPRRVFLADSFRGIPPPNLVKYPADIAHVNAYRLMRGDQRPYTPDTVRAAFRHFHLHDDRHIRILEGYFNESLPRAAARKDFTQFAVVRLDGDTYESTMDTLVALYPWVSPGGFIIVDDYMDWAGCRQATLDFREREGVGEGEELVAVYHDLEAGEVPRGVWWQKQAKPLP